MGEKNHRYKGQVCDRCGVFLTVTVIARERDPGFGRKRNESLENHWRKVCLGTPTSEGRIDLIVKTKAERGLVLNVLGENIFSWVKEEIMSYPEPNVGESIGRRRAGR